MRLNWILSVVLLLHIIKTFAAIEKTKEMTISFGQLSSRILNEHHAGDVVVVAGGKVKRSESSDDSNESESMTTTKKPKRKKQKKKRRKLKNFAKKKSANMIGIKGGGLIGTAVGGPIVGTAVGAAIGKKSKFNLLLAI
jgi:uncharacterized protein (UPF0218 family)